MSADILLVEDSDAEARLVQLALDTAADFPVKVARAATGDAAIRTLFEQPAPGLVLLDINLPGASGHEVLAKIKGHPRLRHVPVVVFSSSVNPRDLRLAYENGANAYIQKPLELDALFDVVRSLTSMWLRLTVRAA